MFILGSRFGAAKLKHTAVHLRPLGIPTTLTQSNVSYMYRISYRVYYIALTYAYNFKTIVYINPTIISDIPEAHPRLHFVQNIQHAYSSATILHSPPPTQIFSHQNSRSMHSPPGPILQSQRRHRAPLAGHIHRGTLRQAGHRRMCRIRT